MTVIDLDEIKSKLTEFKQTEKFKAYQHLQPAVENSTPETIQLVNRIFSDLADDLKAILDAKGFIQPDLKQTLLETIEVFEEQQLDTEDVEFCYELLL